MGPGFDQAGLHVSSIVPPIGLVLKPLPDLVIVDLTAGLAGYMTLTEIMDSSPELIQAMINRVNHIRQQRAQATGR